MPARPAPSLADRLDAALPQMQCRRCGYAGCRPYAEAIACGDAINRCPPGGDARDRGARSDDGTTARRARSRAWASRTADGRPHRRGALHRLHAVPRGVPGRRDRRRRQAHAHGASGAVHRLRSVRRALSRRLHRHRSRRPRLERRRRATRARPLRRARARARARRGRCRGFGRESRCAAGIDADRAFARQAASPPRCSGPVRAAARPAVDIAGACARACFFFAGACRRPPMTAMPPRRRHLHFSATLDEQWDYGKPAESEQRFRPSWRCGPPATRRR